MAGHETSLYICLMIMNLFICELLIHFSELENVEHCGGEPEQAANVFDVGFVTSK